MPEEQPPVDPEHTGSRCSCSRPDGAQDLEPKAAASTDDPPHTARRALPRGEDFRRTVGFTVLGTVVPGVGLIAAGRKVLGSVVLGVFVLVLAALGIAA